MLNMKVWIATFTILDGSELHDMCARWSGGARALPIPHQTLELLLPGFRWISLGSFALGLAESLFYGVYAAAVLVVVHNFFHRLWVGTH